MKFIKAIRLKEIALMTGFSFIGMLFIHVEFFKFKHLLISFISIPSYVINIYALNSMADYTIDKHSSRLSEVSTLDLKHYLLFFIASFIAFSICSISISLTNFTFFIISLALWSLYYLPPLRLKNSFLLGTVIHLFAGITHFHMGYTTFCPTSITSFSISVFFGLLLASGHLHHEIIDYENDKKVDLKTTAVRIGMIRASYLRTLILFFTLLFWTSIYLLNIINTSYYLIFTAPLIVLQITSILLKSTHPYLYQKISRTSFLTSGLILLFSRVFIG